MNKAYKTRYLFMSSILTFNLIFNFSNIHSNAGVLSEDTRYETFEDNDLLIPDILDEDGVDIEVYGNTIKNLIETDTSTPKPIVYHLQSHLQLGKSTSLKAGKTYTISGEFSDIVGTGAVTFNFNSSMSQPDVVIQPKNGFFKRVFTMPDNFSLANGDRIVAYFFDSNNSCKVKNLMILEGDWSNKQTPNYFLGLQSVGESNSDGKMAIKSQSKNLIDIERHTGLKKSENYIEVITPYYNHVEYQLKPDTDYTLSFKKYGSEGCWIAMDINSNYSNNNNGDYSQTFRTGADGILNISIRANTVDNVGHKFYDLMLEEGSLGTNYSEKYVDEQIIDLNEPLRAVPNGLSDKIIKKDGKWYLKRVLGERVFDGSENWVAHGNLTSSTLSYFVLVNNHSSKVDINANTANILTDKFMSVGRGYFASNTTTEAISLHSDVGGGLQSWYSLGIEKNKLSSNDVSGFKNWLSKNPVKVIYPLDIPVLEAISYDSLALYTDTTHIYVNSDVPPVLKTTVDRVLNRAMYYTEIVLSSSKESDLSIARYWTNLLKETIKKDELQERLNGITDLGMKIDKKKVSANADIYIVPKNSLAISLNTNSIVFDDIDGTTSSELLGVIDIDITSTLPYEFSASLATPIENSDKSIQLPNNTLSIKLNSSIDYTPFSADNQKIILNNTDSQLNEDKYSIDFKFLGNPSFKADVYKTSIKFEVIQK